MSIKQTEVVAAKQSVVRANSETDADVIRLSPDVQEIISAMQPGVRYNTRELAKLVGIRAPALNTVLIQALQTGAIREAGRSADNRYWIPTAEQLALEARLQQRNWWCQGALTGYDEEHRQFRNLCMLVRRS
ncbi:MULTISPECIES: hypothetical protein [unclassified Paraburkholderia]|uniref:hypothetical protein n=1 Tax=unclassified Paraburkholderia TaxID=2615204 RepID=UPI002AB23180|nr:MULTISPECIES: hypothetical protein [unclassified Paraburkholderia]